MYVFPDHQKLCIFTLLTTKIVKKAFSFLLTKGPVTLLKILRKTLQMPTGSASPNEGTPKAKAIPSVCQKKAAIIKVTPETRNGVVGAFYF